MDECGSHIALTPLYAWAPSNERATGAVPHRRGQNITLIAALAPGGLTAAMTLDGAADRHAFVAYVRELLVPTLRPGQTVFLANLSAITGSGGNERAINNQLIIYANPNKGSFRIKLPDALTDLTGALLTVYDVQGKEVARFNLEQTSDHPLLEINNAISGFYTVRLVKGKQVFNGKLVVE